VPKEAERKTMSADPSDKPETYRQWFERFLENPTDVDNGVILLLAGIPITLCSVLFGFTLFPPGVYPRLILMAPGLLGAVVLFYILGFILFVNRAIGILVAGLAGLISLWMSVVMIRSLY
jgi:hypothetical protein